MRPLQPLVEIFRQLGGAGRALPSRPQNSSCQHVRRPSAGPPASRHNTRYGRVCRFFGFAGSPEIIFSCKSLIIQWRACMERMYYALLEGRFLFDFVHEDKLAHEDLAKYSALLLPNTALLSDRQCLQLRAYVDGGGSLLATFETSLYTERNQRRGDFGLADVFGIRQAGEIVGTLGNAYLARIEKPHEILTGFSNTNWIPGAENRDRKSVV